MSRSIFTGILVVSVVLYALFADSGSDADEPTIGVRLETNGATSLRLRTDSGDILVWSLDKQPVHAFENEPNIRVAFTGDKITLNDIQVDAVVLQAMRDSTFWLDTGESERAYTGQLRLIPGETPLVVNETGIEDYLAGVVAVEMPFDEIEAVKAQAILARTYALASIARHGKFDLYDDTRSQMYLGANRASSISKRAVHETRGIVLTHNGSLVEALYSSSNGGYTASNETIWGGIPLPYLDQKPDPHDAEAPEPEWSFTINKQTLIQMLSRKFSMEVEDLEVEGNAPDGRWKHFVLIQSGGGKTSVLANTVRQMMIDRYGESSFRSTMFDMRESGNTLRFKGRGFGHGAGLSQWGALGMARKGMSAEEILAFYFRDTDLEGNYGRNGKSHDSF